MKLTAITSVLFVLALVGCASGSAIVVGKKRPSIDPSAVVLYLTPPAHYEVIALIHASSKHGWTEQGRTDHAVDELKEQAADLGANGILLQEAGSQASGGAGVFIPAGNGGTFVMASGHEVSVSGQAIYVQNDSNP